MPRRSYREQPGVSIYSDYIHERPFHIRPVSHASHGVSVGVLEGTDTCPSGDDLDNFEEAHIDDAIGSEASTSYEFIALNSFRWCGYTCMQVSIDTTCK